MSLELKVKAKSLTAEAHIIRREESKLSSAVTMALLDLSVNRPFRGMLLVPEKPEFTPEQRDRIEKRIVANRLKRGSLSAHRRKEVRSESRDTHLARAFLKGRPYIEVERFAWSNPDWGNVEAMVAKYCDGDRRDVRQKFSAWVSVPKEMYADGVLRTKVAQDHCEKNEHRRLNYQAHNTPEQRALRHPDNVVKAS